MRHAPLLLCAVLIFLSCSTQDHSNGGVVQPKWIKQLITQYKKGEISYDELLINESFDSLRTYPHYRKEFRKFMLDRVETTDGFITGYDAINEIQIIGKVVDHISHKGIPHVRAEFVQTGANGLYFDDDSLFNPIHFGFVLSDSTGMFSLKGSLPGHYPDSENTPPPRHTHFNISTSGYRPYNGEFNYSDDTILHALIASGENINDPIAELKSDSPRIYTLTIPLQSLER